LHLALAEVRRCVEQLLIVLLPQVRREQAHGREAHGPFRQRIEDDGKPARGPSGLDAIAGLRFGEVEHLAAIREQGGEPGTPVEFPRVELDQVCDEASGRTALALREPQPVPEQVDIERLNPR
jgi:hypothetical protein